MLNLHNQRIATANDVKQRYFTTDFVDRARKVFYKLVNGAGIRPIETCNIVLMRGGGITSSFVEELYPEIETKVANVGSKRKSGPLFFSPIGNYVHFLITDTFLVSGETISEVVDFLHNVCPGARFSVVVFGITKLFFKNNNIFGKYKYSANINIDLYFGYVENNATIVNGKYVLGTSLFIENRLVSEFGDYGEFYEKGVELGLLRKYNF